MHAIPKGAETREVNIISYHHIRIRLDTKKKEYYRIHFHPWERGGSCRLYWEKEFERSKRPQQVGIYCELRILERSVMDVEKKGEQKMSTNELITYYY